ncbi:Ldh family oxidoreductase [Angustibacter luteus]|uniref:Ldh family oxidoreductase n=1 Tax=Angustibacter luteus TaxID=658456 RepID=A0ABW1JDV6_9ACTN
MTGALSGNHPSTSPDYEAGNGVVLVVIDPQAFVGLDAFLTDTGQCARALRQSAPVDPARPVLLPGDVENAIRAARGELLPLPDQVRDQLAELAEHLGARTLARG